ncbi:uncharacterized protein TNCT_311241 [Trichonephila clavata]|uniref:Uncharacterized protein n=1 Tax=Trichonephila clavata TaxID=2740835 RepID=A0A8X6KW35_TRICU|nr:uncharacterized protein TNCT_311241 [Trichonephila clavata]
MSLMGRRWSIGLELRLNPIFPIHLLRLWKFELNVRYFLCRQRCFMDMVRVGGRILKMVAFPESNLKQTKVCLGDLNLLAQVEPNQDQYFVPPEFNGSTEKRGLEEDDTEETVVDCIPTKHQKTWDPSVVYDVEQSTVEFA